MIVNRLPYLMEQKNVSIRQLSRETGITYTTVRAVYHGERRSIQLEVLDAICQVLDIQPGDIYVRLAKNQVTTNERSAERAAEPVATQPDGGEPQALDKMALELGEESKIDDWKSW